MKQLLLINLKKWKKMSRLMMQRELRMCIELKNMKKLKEFKKIMKLNNFSNLRGKNQTDLSNHRGMKKKRRKNDSSK